MAAKKTNWKKIPDNKVKHVWICTECNEKYDNTPDWYGRNGTPTCTDCDVDCKYSHTEVNIKD
jgi:hypothetical protein